MRTGFKCIMLSSSLLLSAAAAMEIRLLALALTCSLFKSSCCVAPSAPVRESSDALCPDRCWWDRAASLLAAMASLSLLFEDVEESAPQAPIPLLLAAEVPPSARPDPPNCSK
jgi:hypothetical protein